MASKAKIQQFVLLPVRGMRARGPFSSPAAGKFLADLAGYSGMEKTAFRLPQRLYVEMRVLDSIHEDGAKLVELSSGFISTLKAYSPGLRLVPVVYYRPALAPFPSVESAPKVAAAKPVVKIKVQVVSKKDDTPVAGAFVIAFIDFERKIGAQGATNKKGEVQLSLGASSKKLERLYIYPEKSFWPALKKNISISSGACLKLEPIDLSYKDSLRHYYGHSPDDSGAHVKVGVVDTGVGPHPDLVVDGGLNTVLGEDPKDFQDNGAGHGSHVAGIIAARGIPPAGIRGLAPAVVLRSYRVFGKGSDGASNYSLAKAIDRAVADGCDLLNMSLGGGAVDEATKDAISDARARGTLILVAAGNDGRQPVSFPASDSLALAVSALGRKGTFPPGSTSSEYIKGPFGTDKNDFIAAFSNIGPELDLTGPGVAVISTVPGGYAIMDGTSMACPAATGIAAKVLSARTDILNMSRDESRSDAMAMAVLQAAKSMGFGPIYEGQGLVR